MCNNTVFTDRVGFWEIRNKKQKIRNEELGAGFDFVCFVIIFYETGSSWPIGCKKKHRSKSPFAAISVFEHKQFSKGGPDSYRGGGFRIHILPGNFENQFCISHLHQFLLEKFNGSLPCKFCGCFVVTWCGIVVKTVVNSGINMKCIFHFICF